MPACTLSRGSGLFFMSEGGGDTTAVPSSIIISFKRIQINPFSYLRDIFPRISAHPMNRLRDLLLNNWKVAHHATQNLPALPVTS
ncbi:transposase domain-containing protein [bacterium]|nr:transposase domain-containing protein [bacterium]